MGSQSHAVEIKDYLQYRIMKLFKNLNLNFCKLFE